MIPISRSQALVARMRPPLAGHVHAPGALP